MVDAEQMFASHLDSWNDTLRADEVKKKKMTPHISEREKFVEKCCQLLEAMKNLFKATKESLTQKFKDVYQVSEKEFKSHSCTLIKNSNWNKVRAKCDRSFELLNDLGKLPSKLVKLTKTTTVQHATIFLGRLNLQFQSLSFEKQEELRFKLVFYFCEASAVAVSRKRFE